MLTKNCKYYKQRTLSREMGDLLIYYSFTYHINIDYLWLMTSHPPPHPSHHFIQPLSPHIPPSALFYYNFSPFEWWNICFYFASLITRSHLSPPPRGGQLGPFHQIPVSKIRSSLTHRRMKNFRYCDFTLSIKYYNSLFHCALPFIDPSLLPLRPSPISVVKPVRITRWD